MPNTVNLRQGVVEAWNASTGACTLLVAGGQILNAATLKAGAATLKVGDVVTVLSTANQHYILGPSTNPGDPGTVPSWNVDITALTGQVDTITTVTIPAVQNDVTIVQGDVVELNTVTVPAAQAAADAAQTTADTAQSTATTAASDAAAAAADAASAGADAATALGKFPITTTDITDDAITTPKIAANAITAAEIAANAVTTSALAANVVTAAKIAAGTITATELSAGAVTAAKIASGTITATQIAAGTITSTQLSATAVDGKTITGALFRTASSGKRVEIDTANQIRYYSGITGEDAPGTVEAQVEASQYASTRLSSPTISGSPQALTILGSRSDMNKAYQFLYADEIRLNGMNTQVVMAGNSIQLNASSDLAITANRLLFNGYNVQQGGPYIRCSSGTAVSCATGTYTDIANWTTNAVDGITRSSGSFTLPLTGQYFVSAGIAFASGSTVGIRWAQLFRSSTSLALGTTNASSNVVQASFAREISATAGDVIVLKAFQDSGAARNTVAGDGFTYIQIKYIGPS